MLEKLRIEISDARALSVREDIAIGSAPGVRFYALVAVATGIASLGLIMNSTAVVIGAMLVAPLMTPIFGISLALVRGEPHLLGQAVRAEVVGVLLAILLSCCLGLLMPGLEATTEMLSRTKPNLLDLLVAVLAGFAGAYALVDEKISPALPGVAISTAIVPPLANCGLCLALGAYYGAMGSFLLFFANFLSILLVASAVFFAAGMARELQSVAKKVIVRRFGLAVIGFLLVGAFLGNGLYHMVKEKFLSKAINTILTEELSHFPTTQLQQVVYQHYEGRIYVLAHLHAPIDISPARVKKIEESMETKLETPVELFMRSTQTKDISANGAVNQVIAESLDGFSLGQKPDPRIQTLKMAEQLIREALAAKLGFYVEEINQIRVTGHPVILATVFGLRELSGTEIKNIESNIRQAVENDSINLLIRSIPMTLRDRWGRMNFELSGLEKPTPEQMNILTKLLEYIRETFKQSEFYLENIDFSLHRGTYHLLIELVGPRLFSQAEFTPLKEQLSDLAGTPVEIFIRSQLEAVLTKEGPTSFSRLKQKLLEHQQSTYQQEILQALEDAL
jgi:uncharacterized hydrophobic protein (TIGR00271 family)